MKKACIFTFHNVPNYGAVLQAFALSHYVEKEFGYHVDVMDFQCKGNGHEFRPNEYMKQASRSRNILGSGYKRILLSLHFERDYKEKYNKFREFKKSSLSEIPYDRAYECDAVLLGSDQIWNPDITGGFQPEFFGHGDLVKSKVRAAYAASCGDITQLDEPRREELLAHVRSLDYVGVREKSFSDYLTEKGVRNECTLDPTFLLSSDEYNMLVPAKAAEEKPYLLVYELQKNEELERYAFEIAKKYQLEVRFLTGYVSYAKKKTFEIRDAGPIDFLSLVQNASYILTNSFHGTAFSLIYRKDFNAVLPKTRASRIYDLLNELGLTDRIITAGKEDPSIGHIDYSAVEEKLENLETASKCFLRRALGGAAN